MDLWGSRKFLRFRSGRELVKINRRTLHRRRRPASGGRVSRPRETVARTSEIDVNQKSISFQACGIPGKCAAMPGVCIIRSTTCRIAQPQACFSRGWLVLRMLAVLLSLTSFDLCPVAFAQQSPATSRRVAHERSNRQLRGTSSRVGRLPEPAAPASFLNAEQLQKLAPVSYSAVNTPLRQALRKLSETLRVAIVVDRRVDPDQVVDIDLVDVPFAEALQQIAQQAGSGATILGPVAYVGPVESAHQLRTISALAAEEIKRLPSQKQAAARLSRPLSWPALTTPQEVFERLGQEAAIAVRGGDRLPDDLLAAANLPAMPWVDRLALASIQFGLVPRFAADGRSVELVPISEPVRISRSYPAGREAAKTVADWKRLAPNAEIKAAQGKIVVLATIEEHERLVPPRPARSAAATPGQHPLRG